MKLKQYTLLAKNVHSWFTVGVIFVELLKKSLQYSHFIFEYIFKVNNVHFILF